MAFVSCGHELYKKKIHGYYEVNSSSATNSGKSIIIGYVKAKETNEAIENCAVSVKGMKIGTFTDKSGFFQLDLDKGVYSFIAQHVGNTTIETPKVFINDSTKTEIIFYLGYSSIYEMIK
ncbi:MAG: carboxypeptidase-like regulatory domain-containing protein [Bacteroidota bacterium]